LNDPENATGTVTAVPGRQADISSAVTVPNLGTCRKCGQTVRWVKTTSGKNQPLDIDPVTVPGRGNVILIDGVSHYVKNDDREATRASHDIYEAHFSTCKGPS
jgi:hypothetical protein